MSGPLVNLRQGGRTGRSPEEFRMEPLVTVLIPAFNAEHTIARALHSVLIQHYPALEIIVIDDASCDATSAIVRHFDDERIRLLSLSQNLGVSGATNAGLAAAKGEFVAFLDADDEWLPGKIEKQVAVIFGRSEMSLVTCDCAFASVDLQRFSGEPPAVPETEYWRSYLLESRVAKSCAFARRSSLAAVGPFNEKLLIAEDQDMWIRLALAGAVGHVPETLVVRHDTAGSLTKRYAAREAEFILPMIENHVAALAHRLSSAERRHILGSRYAVVGRNLYRSGACLPGLRFLAKASLFGCDPLGNAWYVLTASPPAQRLKHLLHRRLYRKSVDARTRT
jgi:glycosyltransferase involved in cell wall biosynthesis